MRRHHPAEDHQFWHEYMGEGWETELEVQLREFTRTVEYLQAHRVRIAVVLLPQPSWESELPYEGVYNVRIKELCGEREVEVHDWAGSLNDDDFGDGAHVNVYGMEKLHRAIMEIALGHLRATGVVP